MSGARFRYALEPVLLTRQWDLDAQLLALGEHNAAIASQNKLETEVKADIAQANAEYSAMAVAGQAMSAGRFMLANQYLGELARRSREIAARMAELVALRESAIEGVVLARRALDAAERHRDEMQSKFIQQRLSGEFKLADDQWNTLQSGAAGNDR